MGFFENQQWWKSLLVKAKIEENKLKYKEERKDREGR